MQIAMRKCSDTHAAMTINQFENLMRKSVRRLSDVINKGPNNGYPPIEDMVNRMNTAACSLTESPCPHALIWDSGI